MPSKEQLLEVEEKARQLVKEVAKDVGIEAGDIYMLNAYEDSMEVVLVTIETFEVSYTGHKVARELAQELNELGCKAFNIPALKVVNVLVCDEVPVEIFLTDTSLVMRVSNLDLAGHWEIQED